MAEVLCVYREVQALKKAAAKSKKSTKPVAIVSYDEKPGIQAIATTAPDLPPAPGVHPTFTRDHEYKRRGTLSLLATSGLSDELERTQSFKMVVDVGDDDEFIGSGFRNQRINAFANRIRRADDGARQHPHRLSLLYRRPIVLDVVDRRLAEDPARRGRCL